MTSGNNHDKATKLLCLPFGLCISLFLGIENGLIGLISFLVGGLWLSPDLDTKSNASKRWGILSLLWMPYRKLIPHRSLFSHGPLIGTSIRLFYIGSIGFLGLSILHPLGLPTPSDGIKILFTNFSAHKAIFSMIIFGLEASTWLHLIQDGDPLPSELFKKSNH